MFSIGARIIGMFSHGLLVYLHIGYYMLSPWSMGWYAFTWATGMRSVWANGMLTPDATGMTLPDPTSIYHTY